jgi:hypothetical protein
VGKSRSGDGATACSGIRVRVGKRSKIRRIDDSRRIRVQALLARRSGKDNRRTHLNGRCDAVRSSGYRWCTLAGTFAAWRGAFRRATVAVTGRRGASHRGGDYAEQTEPEGEQSCEAPKHGSRNYLSINASEVYSPLTRIRENAHPIRGSTGHVVVCAQVLRPRSGGFQPIFVPLGPVPHG